MNHITKARILKVILESNSLKNRKPSKIQNAIKSSIPFDQTDLKSVKDLTNPDSIRSKTPQPFASGSIFKENSLVNKRVSRKSISKRKCFNGISNTKSKNSPQEIMKKLEDALNKGVETNHLRSNQNEKTEEKMVRRMTELYKLGGINAKKAMKSFANRNDGTTKKRILMIERDQALSPLEKLQTIKSEFEIDNRKYEILQRSKSSVSRIKGKDIYLMSMN